MTATLIMFIMTYSALKQFFEVFFNHGEFQHILLEDILMFIRKRGLY